MSAQRLYSDYIRDMIEYAEKAERFVQGVQFDDFANDEEKILAVTRALEIIGEAAAHIPKHIRDKYPQIPWRKIIGMRNKVTHDYFGVDVQVTWRTVNEDLYPLRQSLSKILQEIQKE